MVQINEKTNKEKTLNKTKMQNKPALQNTKSSIRTTKSNKTVKTKKVTFDSKDSFDSKEDSFDNGDSFDNNDTLVIDQNILNKNTFEKEKGKEKDKKPHLSDISESDYSSDDTDSNTESDESDSEYSDDDQYDNSSDSHSQNANTENEKLQPIKKGMVKKYIKNPNKDHISNFDLTSELMNMFNFRTSASSSIRTDVMMFAIKNIRRKDAIMQLSNYLPIGIADKLEQGILEFSMIQISNENSDVVHFLLNTYHTMTNDICVNLDMKNERINNQTLTPSLLDGVVDPHLIAFMTPQQMHPMRWAKELDRRRVAEEANNNKKVTDIYKCRKCGDKKATTSQMQLRGADEPMTIFVTCLTCYNTFTTQ